jgi:hypothetical protein
MKALKTAALHPQTIGSLLILIVGLLSVSNSLTVPAIFGDDWISYVKLPLEGGLTCPDDQPRFLLNCPPALQIGLFGLNFTAHRLATLLTAFGASIALFLLLNRLFPGYMLVNLGAALLYLVYPLDNFRQFSIVAAYINLSYIFLFLAFIALIRFREAPGAGRWLLAMALFVLSLGLYETVLGVMIAGSLGFYLGSAGLEKRPRLALLGPALLGLAFIVFRALYQLTAGRTYGHPTEQLALAPGELMERVYLALRYLFHWAWTQPLIGALPGLIPPGGHDNLYATLLILGLLLGLAAAIWLLGGMKRLQRASLRLGGYFRARAEAPPKEALALCGLGLLLMGAGFFPILLAFYPMARLEITRVFSLSAAGACLITALALWLLGGGISRLRLKNASLTPLAFVILLTPLVLYGMAVKSLLGESFRQGWETQKAIWNQFFEKAPDFAPGTYVVLLLPNYDKLLDMAPIQAGYDSFEYALSSLYGHRELIGAFREVGLESLVYTRDGLIVDPVYYPVVMPYERVVIFQFDAAQNELQQVKAIPPGVSAALPQGQPLCQDCILPQPARDTSLRWLVQR